MARFSDSSRGGRWRAVGLLVGMGLVGWAVWVVVRGTDWSVLKEVRWWQVAVLGAAVLANLGLSALLFWMVTSLFDAVPAVRLGRMFLLMAASALGNYLPMRAGLVGRTAYLKLRHRLPVYQSAMVLGVVGGVSVLVACGMALVAMLENGWVRLAVGGLVGGLASVLLPMGVEKLLRKKAVGGWLWVWIKAADVLVTAGRLWLALWMVGQPVSVETVLIMAAGGTVAVLAGLTPNGLGLREWVVGGIGELMLPAGGQGALAAALLDRAVEGMVVVVVGSWSVWWLRREWARGGG